MKPTFLVIAALALGSATITTAAPARHSTAAPPPRAAPDNPGGPGAPGGPGGDGAYPACSRTVTDNCIERGGGRETTHRARNTRARAQPHRATRRATRPAAHRAAPAPAARATPAPAARPAPPPAARPAPAPTPPRSR